MSEDKKNDRKQDKTSLEELARRHIQLEKEGKLDTLIGDFQGTELLKTHKKQQKN